MIFRDLSSDLLPYVITHGVRVRQQMLQHIRATRNSISCFSLLFVAKAEKKIQDLSNTRDLHRGGGTYYSEKFY